MDRMTEQFISEKLRPIRGTMDTARMVSGQPGLPKKFLWRGTTIKVEKVLRQWRETGLCRHGSGEVYLRKYWYEVQTACGKLMKLYFLKPSQGNSNETGWRLFSLKEDG